MSDAVAGQGIEVRSVLRKFLHDLATPLSGVSLHLEHASRLASRGEDPAEALAIARKELERTFQLFEEGRDRLLDGDREPGRQG